MALVAGHDPALHWRPRLSALNSAERQQRLDGLQTYAAQARRLEGWFFACEPKPLGPPPPWDYAARARALLAEAGSVVDMGTGGGERFAELLAGL